MAPESIYFGLNAIGDITEIDRSNSIAAGPNQSGPAYSVLSYNTQGQLTGINHQYMGTSLDNLAYTFDPLGRVSTFSSIDGTATYGYDKTSQLVSATYTTATGGHQPPNQSVTFDPNGNLTSTNGTSTTVGADNHLASDGTFTFDYDSSGNLATRTRTSATGNDFLTRYYWDARNRLTDVYFYNVNFTLTQHVHYVYDVWDELIERDLDPNGSGTYTQIVRYVWDGGENGPGMGNIVLAFNGSDQLIARYLNGPSTSAYDQYYTTIAEEDVTSTSSPGTVTYPLLDDQGNVVDVVNSSGSVIDHIVYVATGAVSYESNPSAPHLLSFQGGLLDAATGDELSGVRWKNMADAFWDSQDPIGVFGGINLSAVVLNDPTNLSDPSGLAPRGGGHHDVPWSIFMGDGENAISGFSDDVLGVFHEALEKLFYNHSYDTWKDVTHAQYNTAVRAELLRAMGGAGNAANFTTDQARAFVASILSGECPTGGDTSNWKTIRKFAQGIARSNTVAAAAIANGVPAEEKAVLKALAQLDDLSRVKGGLNSKAAQDALAIVNANKTAQAFYTGWMGTSKVSAGAFRKAAIAAAIGKRLLAPLLAVVAAGRCTRALAQDGLAGGSRELADQLFMANTIEALATSGFEPVGRYFDNSLGNAQMNHMLKRFNKAGVEPGDLQNFRRQVQSNRPGTP